MSTDMAMQISHGLSCTLKGKVCYHPTKAVHDDILALIEYPNLEGIHKDHCSPAPTLQLGSLQKQGKPP